MELAQSELIICLITALLSAALSGVLGMGGGMTLFAVMAQFIAPATLIPIHGIIQFGSNVSRSVILAKHVDLKIAGFFVLGAIMGALVGSQFVVEIPEKISRTLIGLFILWITFGPRPKSLPVWKGKWFVLGSVSTFFSLFIGPTGPLVAPFYLSEKLDRLGLVGTKAACQVSGHFFKVVTYLSLGFVVGPHLGFLAMMIAAVVLGTFLGTRVLTRLPEAPFRLLFRIVIAILAIRLVVLAWL